MSRSASVVRGWISLLGFIMLTAACGSTIPAADPSGPPAAASELVGVSADHPDGWPGITTIDRDVYDPVESGEDLPDGFRQLLGRDMITPVYTPTFVAADEVDWALDEMVIGVDLDEEQRAYPVGFLTRREIVVDLHRGIPTLVTW